MCSLLMQKVQTSCIQIWKWILTLLSFICAKLRWYGRKLMGTMSRMQDGSKLLQLIGKRIAGLVSSLDPFYSQTRRRGDRRERIVAERTPEMYREETEEYGDEGAVSSSTIQQVLGSKTCIELQLLGFLLVFSLSGLVPPHDIAYPIFVSLYTVLLSKCAFPKYPMQASRMNVFYGGRIFHIFILAGTFVGFFLPFAFLLGSFTRGERKAVQAAVPHLFIFIAQTATELYVTGQHNLSPPCRVILSLLYCSRRLSVLSHWTHESFSQPLHETSEWHDLLWLWFGRCLALANILHCGIYTFCMLIPKFLLRAFDRYIMAKRACNIVCSTHRNTILSSGKDDDISPLQQSVRVHTSPKTVMTAGKNLEESVSDRENTAGEVDIPNTSKVIKEELLVGGKGKRILEGEDMQRDLDLDQAYAVRNKIDNKRSLDASSTKRRIKATESDTIIWDYALQPKKQLP
ncbi:hypothetical protein KP509_25G070200 [Ceratopteris richardii]|uniref:DUF7733 domain-containing protein n=1 Tax=Ceratopteris richardii TaxID=49495 RepID=A0A8T2RUB7_CERRI|nr:hypothetical protein KP509_25G070200 [Ceratopteris richardii]